VRISLVEAKGKWTKGGKREKLERRKEEERREGLHDNF